MGGYTPPFQETPTTIESEPVNRYEDQFCTHRSESSKVPVVEDEDEDYFGEDLDDRDEYEERIEKGDFDRDVDNHEITPIPHMLMIWLNVMKMMRTLLLEFSMLQMQPHL